MNCSLIFEGNVSEDLIKKTANSIVSSGLRDLGYVYVNIDDCWASMNRSSNGSLVADPNKFPSGMKSLSDYLHSLGLKLGIYSDAGTKTCQGFPGSYGHEVQDANTFASWGIDYLKLDWCDMEAQDPTQIYPRMRDALAQCGRDIVFSMCEWGLWDPWTWAGPIANLWRTNQDIKDNWFSLLYIVESRVLYDLRDYSGPGGWNDPDMLEVGNGGMTFTQYQSHFTLWCMFAAPLIIGTDVTNMTPETVQILMNKEAIQIDQDQLGVEAKLVSTNYIHDVWARPLYGGSIAVAFFNRWETPINMTVNWSDINLAPDQMASVRDLWLHQDMGGFQNSYTSLVQGSGSVMLKIVPK